MNGIEYLIIAIVIIAFALINDDDYASDARYKQLKNRGK